MTFAYQEELSAGSAGEDVRSATWLLVDDGTVVLTAAGQSHLLRAGDAALVGGQVSHRVATHDGAALIRGDLRAVAAGYPLANPLVVRDFVRQARWGGRAAPPGALWRVRAFLLCFLLVRGYWFVLWAPAMYGLLVSRIIVD
ncbi:hypothetical protein NBCG_02563, partial [Nocardioidaceae bacterium Broad-1]